MKLPRPTWAVLLLLLVALAQVGCAGAGLVDNDQVLNAPGRNVAALSADDVVHVMWRAGFTPDQILQLGPAVRNAVAASGGASIRVGHRVQAILMMQGHQLYVSSLGRGSFVYRPESLSPAQAQASVPSPLRVGASRQTGMARE